jgi:UDP-GlcNAc:undecaprenyl-phosphate GlcNAc-1-phosphate transferase
MITYFVTFLCALMVGLALTLSIRDHALKYGWLDRINSSRKIHAAPIPRLGGIAVVVGFFAPLFALLFVDSGVGQVFRRSPELIAGLFLGGTSIALLGMYDDLRGAGAVLKFLLQFGVAIALYRLGFRIEQIANPFGEPLALGVLGIPFTLLWIVAVINAMNLIDGLDGLAGGVALFAVATNFILAFVRGDVVLCLLMASLAGAVLGFLVFNLHPATIFMGDTGSMFLGFVLAAVSIKTSTKSGTAVALLVPLIALGLPIMDTLLAVLRRTLLGRAVFASDKEHIHHRLMSRLVMSHRRAVLVLYGLCCLFALTALGLAYGNSAEGAMLLGSVVLVVFVLMRKLGYLSFREVALVNGLRRKNIQLRSLVKQVNGDIAGAESVEELWDSVRPLAEALQASTLELRIRKNADGGKDEVVFDTRRDSGSALPLDMTVDILAGGSLIGELRLSWRDGRDEVNRDEELAVELVADSIAKAAAVILSVGQPSFQEGMVNVVSLGK